MTSDLIKRSASRASVALLPGAYWEPRMQRFVAPQDPDAEEEAHRCIEEAAEKLRLPQRES